MKLVDILLQIKPEIKPEAQFEPSEAEQEDKNSSARFSQKEPPKRSIRSLRSGKPMPCDVCGHVWVLERRCIGCGVERVTNCEGLEAIGSILARLPFVQEGGEAS